MTTIQRDYYKVLQVDPEASTEVITAAFKVLAKRWHPETDLSGVHEIRLGELNRAYGVLKNVASRRAYDEERMLRMNPMGPGPEPEPVLAPVVVPPPRRHMSADGTPDGDAMLSRMGGSPPPITSAETSLTAGDMRLDFGRYAGWSLYDLARKDPAYLRWLARHSSGLRFRREISLVLGEPMDDPYAPSR